MVCSNKCILVLGCVVLLPLLTIFWLDVRSNDVKSCSPTNQCEFSTAGEQLGVNGFETTNFGNKKQVACVSEKNVVEKAFAPELDCKCVKSSCKVVPRGAPNQN